MKVLFKSKDGGPDSNVTGYWLFESKMFGSIVVLRFDKGSREAYHNHAFNALSWIIWGELTEYMKQGGYNTLQPSLIPIITTRDTFHKVYGESKSTWALSFRGPWQDTWKEYFPKLNKYITLTHGRKKVDE